jgi:L-iditol 2-dehydrogenase
MKTAKLYSYHDIRMEDIPIPKPGPYEALMKTGACGICSGDVMPWYIEKKAPLVLGHEPAGEIITAGEKVSKFKSGDRVFVHHHAPCFACGYCNRKDYVQCETWKNSSIIPGGISEYILIPAINLENDTIGLPGAMSFEDATLIEPTACVVKGLRRTRLQRGDTALVIGLGVMGLIHILLLKEFGAGRIIAADMVPYRLAKALDFGADAVIDVTKTGIEQGLASLTQGKMAELVIVGPNSCEVMAQGIACARAGGQVLFFTPAKPGEKLSLDPNHLYFRDIDIITSYSCGPNDTAEACGLIEKQVVSSEKLVTHRFPIEKTEEAFRLTAIAGESLKSLIVFD